MRTDVKQAHQIKPETVNVIFLCPVKHGIENVSCAHAALAGNLAAAAGTV